MNYLQKMDLLLNSLYIHSGRNQTFEMIESALKDEEIEKGEIQDCLLHLHRRGQIYCEIDGNRNHPYLDVTNTHYIISFAGKVFHDTIGGYEQEYNSFLQDVADTEHRDEDAVALNIRAENNQFRLNKLTFWLMVGSFLLAAIEIFRFFWELYHPTSIQLYF